MIIAIKFKTNPEMYMEIVKYLLHIYIHKKLVYGIITHKC